MATTQSKDPNEQVHHPRHYNQHASNVETIEITRHLPGNFANAVKYVWRCGLKTSAHPRRDLESARWYTLDEMKRRDVFELDIEAVPKTDVVWRALAYQVIEADRGSILGLYLAALLRLDFDDMLFVLDRAIEEHTPAKVAIE